MPRNRYPGEHSSATKESSARARLDQPDLTGSGAPQEADLRAAVERLTGRTVVAFLGADQLEPDVEAEIFILDAPP
jgi:hypothetical protein